MPPILYEPRSVFSGVRRRVKQEYPQFTIVMIPAKPITRLVNFEQFLAIPSSYKVFTLKGTEIHELGSSLRHRRPAAVALSFAIWNTKREERRVWRTSLRTHNVWRFPHASPDSNCRSIHVQEPYLFAALTSYAVDADRPQKVCLPGREKKRCYADGRCILGVLHIFCTLRNDLIIQSWRRVLRHEASQKIVRVVNPIRYKDAHSAPRSENQ